VQRQSIRNGAIGVEYTSKALSGWGGLSLIFEYLDRIGFSERLRGAVREMKRSNNRVENCDVVLTFLATVLVGGNRFAHVQRVLHDEVVHQISGARRLGSEDTVRRFFLSLRQSEAEDLYTDLHRFTSELMLRHTTEDVLDLDSTILERYGHQEGASKSYHGGRSAQQSHHPLLGMFSRSRHIALVWLRAGGAQTLRGADAFVQELLGRLPEGFRITAIRADSGFFNQEYLRLFEEKNLPYIIPMRMHAPIKRFIASIPTDQWEPLDEQQDIADVRYTAHGWEAGRRVVAFRKKMKADGNVLFDVPSYEYGALVTSLGGTARECSDFYDQRGRCENTIKEFKNDFGARGFSLARFTATEAAFRLISILFNLVSEFKREVLHDTSLTLGTIRTTLFVIGAAMGRAARRTILRLAVRHRRGWFSELLDRASSVTYPSAPQFVPTG
jgi:hypothetical protein